MLGHITSQELPLMGSEELYLLSDSSPAMSSNVKIQNFQNPSKNIIETVPIQIEKGGEKKIIFSPVDLPAMQKKQPFPWKKYAVFATCVIGLGALFFRRK